MNSWTEVTKKRKPQSPLVSREKERKGEEETIDNMAPNGIKPSEADLIIKARKKEYETALKKFYKWFSIFSIWIIPAGFLLLVPWLVYANAKYVYYEARLEFKTAAIYQKRSNEMATAVDYLGPITNLISCVILGLVIQLVRKLSK